LTSPQTRYVRNGDVSLAYQVIGDAPVTLVYVAGFFSHVEHVWEEPGLARFFERIASFARLVIYDRRGSGLSDPVSPDASLDSELGDLDAVLDAVGAERAALMGYINGGHVVARYAAERPWRVQAVIFYGSSARSTSADDYEWAYTEEERRRRFAEQLPRWGEGTTLDLIAPSCAGDERMRAWMSRMERLGASPGMVATAVERLAGVDVRDALGRITAPALVLHRTHDSFIDVRHSRYLAEHVPGARLVELPGTDSLPSVGDSDAVLDEIEEFLTGGRAEREPERALGTVLFTDIVDGTAQAAQLGDRAWRDRLAAHDSAVRRQLERFGGREVKTTGDGFLALFDGPPSRAARCARAIVDAVAGIGVRVRAGLHTGECELIGGDVGGLAVHIAARVTALAGAGEVLVSSTLRDAALGSGLEFSAYGEHDLKGVPERWRVFRLT
jgi:class 3 adenylate cyclase/pimeloyl-ACP methyl ester carboxylesterase